jgi:phytoene synthase
LDLESVSGLSLDVWTEIRDELDDALAGRLQSSTHAALLDTLNRFDFPREHLFEMLNAADWWIRNRGCETFDQTSVFAARLGGSMMAACACVLGMRPGGEVPAIECGQAIQLTQMLAHLVSDLKEQKSYLAREDYAQCGVDTARIKMRQPSPEFRHFVRQYTARIEQLFLDGGQLTAHLDFGGARTVSSILDYHWKMFCKIRAEPELILVSPSVMTRHDKFKLRTRHLLGLEGKAPVICHGAEYH